MGHRCGGGVVAEDFAAPPESKVGRDGDDGLRTTLRQNEKLRRCRFAVQRKVAKFVIINSVEPAWTRIVVPHRPWSAVR